MPGDMVIPWEDLLCDLNRKGPVSNDSKGKARDRQTCGVAFGAQLCGRTHNSLSAALSRPYVVGALQWRCVERSPARYSTGQGKGEHQRCHLLSPRSVAPRCRGDARTKPLSCSSCSQSFARSCRTRMLCTPDVSCKRRRCDAARDKLGAWHVCLEPVAGAFRIKTNVVRACGWGL